MPSRLRSIRADAPVSTGAAPLHPGQYVRDQVLKPMKLSVTAAAKLIDISRTGVSSFLNGHVAATPEMAARIERAFKIPAQELLDMQTKFDAAAAKSKGVATSTRHYVPPFLKITANDVEAWATQNIPARTRLSVLLRSLVQSTGVGLTKVDFPGNDDAERPGWDGFVEASQGTPWIPEGQSGWEFGVTKNVKGKADGDFKKSIDAITRAERAKMTFAFVTPRRWAGKTEWVREATASGQWKAVRAYDASDLEQWLEQSLAGQTWFANETKLPADGVRSLDKCWSDWSDVASPPLTGSLFDSAIEASKRALQSRISKDAERPIVIAADSIGESLAFLSQLFSDRGGPEFANLRDRVMVFDKPGVLPRLSAGTQNFIPIAASSEVERELAPLSRSMHCIVVCPRNAANAEPDFVLEPVGYDAFQKSLAEMNKDRDEITRLENASGRSLTVLRRQLSDVPAVRTPVWANHETATALVPFALVGAWNSKNKTDTEALGLLAERPYGDLEKDCQRLIRLDDAPMWAVGGFRGVISKIDLLFAVAGAVTAEDLKRYFAMARMVLGEDDPTLDLNEDDRWFAALHHKVREFSRAFRDGISETLVLLSVHGNNLFKPVTGFDCGLEATRVIHDLLPTPLDRRALEANDRDLPTYAEAVPDTFLSIIEDDLKRDAPAVFELMRPVESGFFGRSPSRTGLLWALEGLSWNPETLPRAALILGRLAQIEITDNWVNKPTNSLESVFRAWMPQTAASHDVRIAVMKKLAERFPEVAWKICISQFGDHHAVGHYSHKPRWRPDGYGFGEPFKFTKPIHDFQREMVEMALGWSGGHTLDMVCDLISRLNALGEDYQERLWGLVKTWAQSASDYDKAGLREKIRVTTLSARAARQAKRGNNKAALSKAAKEAYAALEPSDILNRHAWLFREGWVEESYDEIHGDEELDFKAREERIKMLRVEALHEVYNERGSGGLIELAERGKAAWQIGVLCTLEVLSCEDLIAFLLKAFESLLQNQGDPFVRKNLLAGALRALPTDQLEPSVQRLTAGLNDESDTVHLLLLAPFARATWSLVDRLSDAAREKYWTNIAPDWIVNSDEENNEAVERLLRADRPRAAFSCARFHPEKLDIRMLFELLSHVARGGSEKPGHYQLEQYNIETAFKLISASSEFTLDQKAGLEFAYIDALARPWSTNQTHGIPNLEKYIALHPELYVQAVAWTYRRDDEGVDPPEMQVPDEGKKHMGQRGYKLLDGLERVPGYNDLDELEYSRLAKWVKTVRDSCAAIGRKDVGDISIGRLLSAAPIGRDGVWPCEEVRQVLEDVQSEKIMNGAHTGLYNARGVHWRGEGGDQERELAVKYRKWAEALRFTYPYVSSKLLMGMVKTYEHEADREDTEAGIRRRLR